MGRIVVTEYISVDGVVEAPSGTETFERVGWTDAFSRGPEGEQFKLDETMASDALLLGRVTYDVFAPVWPHVQGEFADKFNSMPKYSSPPPSRTRSGTTRRCFVATSSKRSPSSKKSMQGTSSSTAARSLRRP
jgi:dihydrofolate reductase